MIGIIGIGPFGELAAEAAAEGKAIRMELI
jgi:hypothetical protein